MFIYISSGYLRWTENKKEIEEKVKLIHEVHDMWPLTLIEIGGMSKKHPFIRVMQKERIFFAGIQI